jgi:hypothetical protein
MTNDHDLDFRLAAAAKHGDDLFGLLAAERAHLLECNVCRQKLIHALDSILNQEERLFLQTVAMTDLGELEVPYSSLCWRLPASKISLWESNGNVRQLSRDVTLRIRLSRRQLQANFQELSGWLSPSQSVVLAPVPLAAGMTRQPKQAQAGLLDLPDQEYNILFTLVVVPTGRGKAHLDFEISQLSPKLSMDRVRVTLLSPHGEETTYTKNGKVSFVDLGRGKYTIEVKPTFGEKTGGIWQFGIAFEES